MLDLLPNEIWSDSSIKILDPACKSWVFLREAAKRLLKGLEKEIPDLQERINHIMTKQLYWIAITNLTALLSRRSLYCSKNAKYDPDIRLQSFSICTEFEENRGNIRYWEVKHKWENWTCIYCWANEKMFWTEKRENLETHAYKFIHSTPEEINALFWLDPNMKPDVFDVIIGNPPYQLTTTEIEWKANATPLYHKFIEQAQKLQPKYLSMIIPSRRMTWGSVSLNDFRKSMIHDKRMKVLHDYIDSKQVFTWVDVKWGICYFLWDKWYNWICKIYSHNADSLEENDRYLAEEWDDIFIRNNRLVSIKNKVWHDNNIDNVESITSPQTPYWLLSNSFTENPQMFLAEKVQWSKYRVVWLWKNQAREFRYTSSDFVLTKDFSSETYKVFVPKAYWCWAIWETIPTPILWTPILWTPMDICTQTFIQIWWFDTKNEAENFLWYLKTKFFRTLVGIKKNTQDSNRIVYHFVPLQDFSKPRTDEELYAKYNLSQEEIDYIETMIKPMD